MDLTAHVEHQCCAGAIIVILVDGAKVYLDERLELEWGTLRLSLASSRFFQDDVHIVRLPPLNFPRLVSPQLQEHQIGGQFTKKVEQKKSKSAMLDTRRLIPASIFARARFVIWKKPSFTTRNTWYIPVWRHVENNFPENKDLEVNREIVFVYRQKKKLIATFLILQRLYQQMICSPLRWDSGKFSYPDWVVSAPEPAKSKRNTYARTKQKTKPNRQNNSDMEIMHTYPGEKNSFLWNIDKVQVSIFFTDHQEMSIQAYINGIHVSVYRDACGYQICAGGHVSLVVMC